MVGLDQQDKLYDPNMDLGFISYAYKNIPVISSKKITLLNFSLIGFDGCYLLWSLLRGTKNLIGDVIEVGVYKGGSACLLAGCSKHYNMNNSIYFCDTFEGVVKSSDKDEYYNDGEFSDTSAEGVNALIEICKFDNVKILKGVFPDDNIFIKELKNKKFRFCHIDVDTYNSAKDSFEFLWPKIVDGGVLHFDDYGCPDTNGVTDFVNTISKNMSLKIWKSNDYFIGNKIKARRPIGCYFVKGYKKT